MLKGYKVGCIDYDGIIIVPYFHSALRLKYLYSIIMPMKLVYV